MLVKRRVRFPFRGKWHNYYKIYFFLALFAILITILFFSFSKISFKKYRTRFSTEPAFKTAHPYYHDFDHDGFSERFELKKNPPFYEPAIKVYTYTSKLIDQWNFAEDWLPRSVIFGDYDEDNYDEAYCFTVGNDSLFLYGMDPRQPSRFFLYRKFIARAPQPNPNSKNRWDIQSINGILLDCNGDGFKELVFNVMCGFSLQPRRIYAFDIRNKQIIAQSPEGGAYLNIPLAYDFNGDQKPEILLKFSPATGNYHQEINYRDNQAWLFFLDRKLRPLFPPIGFAPTFSSITNVPFQTSEKTYIAVLRIYRGQFDINPTIYLYDFQGQMVRERKLSSEYYWYLETLPGNRRTHLYIYNSDGIVEELNEKLQTIRQLRVAPPITNLLFDADLNNDLQHEYLFADQKGYTIVSSDFTNFTHIEGVPRTLDDIVSIRKHGEKPPELVIYNGKKLYRIRYFANPLYPFRYVIFLLATLVIYALLTGIFSILRSLLLYDRFWQFLFLYSNHGIALLDHKGRIKNLNAMLEHQLQMRHHIQDRERFDKAFAERLEILSILNKFFENPRPLQEDLTFSTETGSFKGNIRVYPLVGPWSIPLGYSIEITNHSQPIQAEKIQIWSKTVQKMAHDIKTPLSAIQLSLQTLQMKLSDISPQSLKKLENDFSLINKELKRVKEMTKNFLKFTNLEKPNLQYIAIKQIIAHAVKQFKNYFNHRLKLQLDMDPDITHIWADPAQLQMVFQILIENAIDAMQGQGHILISTSLAQYLDKNFKKYLEIEFADNGPGIEPELLEKVFDPFFSTKAEGTGMGLPIAKKIIEDHGGNISITSRENFATVIRITLPIGNIPEESHA